MDSFREFDEIFDFIKGIEALGFTPSIDQIVEWGREDLKHADIDEWLDYVQQQLNE